MQSQRSHSRSPGRSRSPSWSGSSVSSRGARRRARSWSRSASDSPPRQRTPPREKDEESTMWLHDFAPGQLYVAKQLQPRPYTPLNGAAVAHLARTGSALRFLPRVHMVQRAFTDFYNAVNNSYGVSCEPHSLVCGTELRRRTKREAPPEVPPPVHLAGAAPEVDPRSLSLRELRNKTVRNNSATQSRACSFYLTKEGCRRGLDCPFVHQGTPHSAKAAAAADALATLSALVKQPQAPPPLHPPQRPVRSSEASVGGSAPSAASLFKRQTAK